MQLLKPIFKGVLRQNKQHYIHHYWRRYIHRSPILHRKKNPENEDKYIEIDSKKEELFPTRRGHIIYEQELALSEKIRSARAQRKDKKHSIETAKISRLTYLILQEVLHNGALRNVIVRWSELGYIPDHVTDTHEVVSLNLPMIGFNLVGVVLPNHRQWCEIHWDYNKYCALPCGKELIKYIIKYYHQTFRAILAIRLNLKRAPQVVFKYTEQELGTETLLYKDKIERIMDEIQYQGFTHIDKDSKGNESVNNVLKMNEALHGNYFGKERQKLVDELNEMAKWEQRLKRMWLTRGDKRDLNYRRKKWEQLVKRNTYRGKIVGMIMAADPHFKVINYGRDNEGSLENQLTVIKNNNDESMETSDKVVIIPRQRELMAVPPYANERKIYTSGDFVYEGNEQDLVGFVQ